MRCYIVVLVAADKAHHPPVGPRNAACFVEICTAVDVDVALHIVRLPCNVKEHRVVRFRVDAAHVHVIGEKHAVGRKQQRVAGRTEFALAEILGNIAEIDIHADNAEDISFVVADGAVFGQCDQTRELILVRADPDGFVFLGKLIVLILDDGGHAKAFVIDGRYGEIVSRLGAEYRSCDDVVCALKAAQESQRIGEIPGL